MKTSKMLAGLYAAPILGAAVPDRDLPRQRAYPPDRGNLTLNGQHSQLPIPFNLSDSQHAANGPIDGSFWANAFIYGSNGHNYYIAAHVQSYGSDIPGAVPIYRSSLLDVTDPSVYHKVLQTADDPDLSFWDEAGEFHAVFGDEFGVEALSTADPLQGLHVQSSLADLEFDWTFSFTSPALLNAALGSYLVNGDYGYEWSVPRGAIAGWLKVGDEVIDIVPEKSSAWYDRQWASLQGSFNWIAMNFDDSDWLDLKSLAVWDWQDPVQGRKQFATARSPRTGRDSVVPSLTKLSETKTYTSPETDLVFPNEWTVIIEDVEILVSTPRNDQIFEADPEVGFPPQFSGYVELEARRAGHPPVRGWGAVDYLIL